MSYINDALRKAQKDKSRYVSYDHIVSAPGKKSESTKKWLLIIGISTICLGAAAIMALMYWPADKKVEAQGINAPPVAASAVVEGREPNKNMTVELKPQEDAAPVKVQQKIDQSKALLVETSAVVDERKPEKNARVEHKQPKEIAQVKSEQKIDQSKALFAQALELQRQGKFDKAKILYRKVVKIDPQNLQAFNNLGVIYMSQKKYRRAIMRFNDALRIKHDYPDAHYNLACIYAQKNDVSRSLLHLQEAIEINPEVKTWAQTDTDLKALFETPGYKKLMERRQN